LGKQAPAELAQRLLRPFPRIHEGLQLRDLATSAIDVSDGLAADLGHILEQSHVGATIIVEQLPLSGALSANTSLAQAQQLALSAGDDYELCFTIAPQKAMLLANLEIDCRCIGIIETHPGLRVQHKNGNNFILNSTGYQHF
jgi:thiamine-monophosphate kinase